MSSTFSSNGFYFTSRHMCSMCKANVATIQDEAEPEGKFVVPYPIRYYCLPCFQSLGGMHDTQSGQSV